MREGLPSPTCHVSSVTCHMSRVTCHVSRVTCHIILIFFFLQIGKASRWRVCLQRGLPRLVFKLVDMKSAPIYNDNILDM